MELDRKLLVYINEFHLIKDKYQKPGNVYLGLIHRLDRPVSGIMVFAKTSKCAARLTEQIQNKNNKKSYLAVIRGKTKKEDTLIDYLEKVNTKSFITNEKDGKLALLSYERLDYLEKEDLSLVKINLKTGRNHQIRVQFASRNHPLYGDLKYGFDTNKNLGLYAYQLEFIHPTTKEKLTFTNYPNYNPFTKFKKLK